MKDKPTQQEQNEINKILRSLNISFPALENAEKERIEKAKPYKNHFAVDIIQFNKGKALKDEMKLKSSNALIKMAFKSIELLNNNNTKEEDLKGDNALNHSHGKS